MSTFEEEAPPPENTDPVPVPPTLDDLEYDLPVPDAVPPDEVQERLEAPTGVHLLIAADGSTSTLETAPMTEEGVVLIHTEPDALADKSGELPPSESALAPEAQTAEGATAP